MIWQADGKKKRRVQMKKKQLGIIEEGSFQKDDT